MARRDLSMALLDRILSEIDANGPITVASFMERALYDPAEGYYATAAQRSGREGDFYTSVDVGPLFGELLAEFVVRKWRAWIATARPGETFDLVEAGAGNGRLTRDVLDALAREHEDCYQAVRVRLVERSAAARLAQPATLGPHVARLASATEELPAHLSGVLLANELLDAFPVHRVVMTAEGLRELYVGAADGELALQAGPVSSPVVRRYLEDAGIRLARGAIADISPAAVAWVHDAAARMDRGAMLFIDYGHEAPELFSPPRAEGTLASYARHHLDPHSPTRGARQPAWLQAPGTRDITAHVDFTSVARVAGREGWIRESLVDQSRLLIDLGLGPRLERSTGAGPADIRRRLSAKALAMPTGLGASHRALVLTKGLGTPQV